MNDPEGSSVEFSALVEQFEAARLDLEIIIGIFEEKKEITDTINSCIKFTNTILSRITDPHGEPLCHFPKADGVPCQHKGKKDSFGFCGQHKKQDLSSHGKAYNVTEPVGGASTFQGILDCTS